MRNYVPSGDVNQSFSFDLDNTHVVALSDLNTRSVLLGSANTDFSENFLFSLEEGVQFREFFIDVKSSLLGFVSPFLAVAVAVESNLLGLLDVFLDDIIDFFAAVEQFGNFSDLSSHSGRDDSHREGSVLGGAQSSELEDTASVGERTGSVSIRVFLVDVEVEGVDFVSQVVDGRGRFPFEHVGDGVTQEDGENSGWSLVTSKSDFIAGSGDGSHIQLFVLEDGHDLDKHEELVDLGIEFRIAVALLEDVLDGAVFFDVGEVIVGVFAGAVDMVERLLMEESSEAVSGVGLFHDLHDKHVLVDGDTGLAENTGNLELVDCHFVVTGLERNTDFKQLLFDFLEGLFND